MKLPLKKIRTDGGTQPRALIDEDIVEQYMERMSAGDEFPPLVVFHDGKDHWLADGFHRYRGADNLDWLEIECDIRQGTLADAQWFSFSANRTNGLHRSKEDVRRAVVAALAMRPELGDAEIARHVGVHRHTVQGHRKGTPGHLVQNGQDTPKAQLDEVRTVTRKGKTYKMKVGQIGKAKKPNRKKFGGIAKDAAIPIRKPGQMIPTLTISIPLNSPDAAAGALLSNCEPAYLRAMVARITAVLDERGLS